MAKYICKLEFAHKISIYDKNKLITNPLEYQEDGFFGLFALDDENAIKHIKEFMENFEHPLKDILETKD